MHLFAPLRLNTTKYMSGPKYSGFVPIMHFKLHICSYELSFYSKNSILSYVILLKRICYWIVFNLVTCNLFFVFWTSDQTFIFQFELYKKGKKNVILHAFLWSRTYLKMKAFYVLIDSVHCMYDTSHSQKRKMKFMSRL